ncbi:MAG TPA: AI-2E family transporter, partial [Woeseiaceae bacterium]|nr:AI-2E family transporter [Woeseiaceae bacterium]
MNAPDPPETVEAPPYVLPAVLILVTLAFILLILDFYKAIVWAFVFALLAYPLYTRLRGRAGGRGAAAGLTTVVVVLLVLLPAIGFGTILARQATDVVQGIQDGEIDPAAPVRWITEQVPRLSRWLESVGVKVGDIESQLSGSISSGGELVASQVFVLGQGALRTSLLLALTAYLLFFFLYDARRILRFIQQALPI